MSKRPEIEEQTVTISRAEYDALLSRERIAGTDGITRSAEERTSLQLGLPVPDRTPWKIEVVHCREEFPLAGGWVEFTAEIMVRPGYEAPDAKEFVQREMGERTVFKTTITKYPPLETMMAKFGMNDQSATTILGGKTRPELKEGVRFSVPFLNELRQRVQIPIESHQGKPLSRIAHLCVDKPTERDLGEVRRENDRGGKRAA